MNRGEIARSSTTTKEVEKIAEKNKQPWVKMAPAVFLFKIKSYLFLSKISDIANSE